jgi:hypothetical protein
MFPASWSIPFLIKDLVWPLAVVAFMLAALQFGRLRKTRPQLERKLAELAQRLRGIESRLDRLENRGRNPASERETSASPVAQKINSSGSPGLLLAHFDGRGEAPTSPTLIAIPDLASERHQGLNESASELSQRHAEIWSLAGSGASAEEIARQTGQPIGQVELILGLHRRLHPVRTPVDHARPH